MSSNPIPDQERFLYCLSALGSVDKPVFRQWFKELCLRSSAKEGSDISFIANRYIRLMQALGHLDDSGGKLWACPPLLSIIRDKPRPIALLSGARDTGLISQLDQIIFTEFPGCEALCVKQSQRIYDDIELLFPDAYLIKNINVSDLKGVAEMLGIGIQHEEAARALLSYAGGIDLAGRGLVWGKCREDEPINSINRFFSPHVLHFISEREEGRDYRLVEYKLSGYSYQYWFWDDKGKGAVVPRDWGRYLALNTEGINILIYDEDTESLAVPTNVPLPVHLSRAATACSGLIPYEVRSGNLSDLGLNVDKVPFDVYFGITKNIGETIAERLGQRLITVGGVFQPEICTL